MAGNNNYVLDASALLAILLPDEKTKGNALSFLEIIADRTTTIWAPHLIEMEFGNVLKTAIIRKRINRDDIPEIFYRYKRLPIKFAEVNFLETAQISIEEEMSFYDAAYLYLAKKTGSPILTLDQKLLEKVL